MDTLSTPSRGTRVTFQQSLHDLRKRRAFAAGEKLTPYFYILPAFLFLSAILGFPILFSLGISFQNFTLETLISKQTHWIGFQNYMQVLGDPAFATALTHSLIFTLFSILFQFTFGLGLALLFGKAFPLSNVMRGLLLSGWQIPSVATGTIFLWLFNLDYGLINFLLTSSGALKEPVGWVVQSDAALPAVIIANVWLGIPFNVILLSAGIAGLPEDVYEAATVDGATGWQKTIYLTLPLLKSTILAVLMLGFIYTLRVFDLIWIMTKGGPGDATEVLPTLAYRLAFVHFNFGQSAAVAVIILLILLTAAVGYLKFTLNEEPLL
jgi:multiple sugar transport system permease protein